jgi:hypothetical protein
MCLRFDSLLLSLGQVRPPFVPLTGGDPADTRNFDSEFTKMTVKDAGGAGGGDEGQASLLDYEGFSFLDDEYKQLRGRTGSGPDEYDQDQDQDEGGGGVFMDGEASVVNSVAMYSKCCDMLLFSFHWVQSLSSLTTASCRRSVLRW